MKRVFSSHEEVARVWASQTQEEGRGKRVFFRGPVIYSHGTHFPIARIISSTAVFTTKTYSPSTNQHVSHANRAVSHMHKLHVLDPVGSADSQFDDTCRQVISLLKSAKRARVNKPYLLARAEDKASDFNAYAELTGEKCRIPSGTVHSLKANNGEPCWPTTELSVDSIKQFLELREAERERQNKLRWMKDRVLHGASRYS